MAEPAWWVRLWRGTDPARRSKLGQAALLLGVASFVAAGVAAAGHRGEWMAYGTGFQVLRWAAWVALAGAVLGIVAIVRALGPRRRGWIPGLVGLLLGLGWLAVPSYYTFLVLPNVPRIHDITTDTEQPPAFAAIVPLRVGTPNPPAYDGPEVAALQKQAYPDLAPLRLSQPPALVFLAALDAVQSQGLTLVSGSAQDGRIEAFERTLFFGFVDDVVIRVQADGAGTRVDVRSKSREGRSDFGVNAARVRKLLAAIQAKAK